MFSRPASNSRRRTVERRFIPAHVLDARGDIVGRVRDASERGLQLELTRPLGPGDEALELVGASRRQRINLETRWERLGPGARRLVGVETTSSMDAFIASEKAAYDEVNLETIADVHSPQALAAIAASELQHANATVTRFIERYNAECEQPRAAFLWGWVLNALTMTEFPGVSPAHRETVGTAKFLGVVLDVILDDIADSGTAPELVLAACDSAFRGRAVPDGLQSLSSELGLAAEVWSEIKSLLRTLPQHETLRDFLAFDYRQLENALHYASVLNRSTFASNATENTVYQCHNMHMLISGTVDLMGQLQLDTDEVGIMRELFYFGQLMGRIGNAVTTWPRELVDGDLSSAFFSTLAEGAGYPTPMLAELGVEDLKALEQEVGAEQTLLNQWAGYRNRARSLANRLYSVAAHDYVDGLEQLLSMHLGSRGLK